MKKGETIRIEAQDYFMGPKTTVSAKVMGFLGDFTVALMYQGEVHLGTLSMSGVFRNEGTMVKGAILLD